MSQPAPTMVSSETPGAIRVPASGMVPYRLTVRQFERMIDAGIFRDEDHVELLGGLLVDAMVKHPPHCVAVAGLAAAIRRLLGPGWFVYEEKSIQLGRFWRLEPDVAVVRGQLADYSRQHPTASDVGMLVEVSENTYWKDRGAKWRRYAAVRIPHYWIVNLSERRIEVYSSPSGRGASAEYQEQRNFGTEEEVPLIIEGREPGRIAVRDVLPLVEDPPASSTDRGRS